MGKTLNIFIVSFAIALFRFIPSLFIIIYLYKEYPQETLSGFILFNVSFYRVFFLHIAQIFFASIIQMVLGSETAQIDNFEIIIKKISSYAILIVGINLLFSVVSLYILSSINHMNDYYQYMYEYSSRLISINNVQIYAVMGAFLFIQLLTMRDYIISNSNKIKILVVTSAMLLLTNNYLG